MTIGCNIKSVKRLRLETSRNIWRKFSTIP